MFRKAKKETIRIILEIIVAILSAILGVLAGQARIIQNFLNF